MKRSRRNHLLLQKNKRQKRLNRTLVPENTERKALISVLPYL
ncbi:MAG: hypothetical protein UY87_C0053G0006 [Candidatus Peribacteria bacterium GW2011_GWC2_54_8]|nr:MAG: hypothetical protein UY87_C0053G0006 [Candidatus Peribacteria bacterium GW2011_GWC2_54_8]KKW39910.1 MAG: hypothetical protein UY90_C0093G0002 [Candidatus Peregrinibacteria bacterium GW2011_GWA2_54_9]